MNSLSVILNISSLTITSLSLMSPTAAELASTVSDIQPSFSSLLSIESQSLSTAEPGVHLTSSLLPSPLTQSMNATRSTHLTSSLLPSPSLTPPVTIATTHAQAPINPTQSSGAVVGTAIGTLLLIAIFGSLITLAILVGLLFRKINRNGGTIRKKSTRRGREKRVFSIASSSYASINDRGRIRRQASGQQSQRSRAARSMLRNIFHTRDAREIMESDYTSPRNPLLPVHVRTQVKNGALSPDYELDMGDYTSPVFTPAEKEEDLLMQLASLGIEEIPEDQLSFEEQIGKGQFGTVYKARWTFPVKEGEGPSSRIVSAYVAVKMMAGSKSQEDRMKFLQEAVLLGQFNDPNIVAVFGVITKSNELMMICELMDEDLRANLTQVKERLKNNEVTDQERSELPALLLSYCRKIASTFVYLGLKGFVHRDLAARNILVSKEGDCKLSDFGLSRQLASDDFYLSRGGMVPVKWTSPEAIMLKKYSTKSDVWSYGILLYEIWALGTKPYQGMSNQEVVTTIPTGYRLPPPPGCPRAIYNLMITCTHPEAESRPSFTNILTSLQRPDYKLLQWSESEGGSEGARTLGGPLEDGETLYTELQNKYKLTESGDWPQA